ncbi:Uncharacterised protein [Mycobacteroides abscessus subsp. abscessus]|nr:Uncharacterised protein [Mycobacteroides abscessus subsp. abscessus]
MRSGPISVKEPSCTQDQRTGAHTRHISTQLPDATYLFDECLIADRTGDVATAWH